MNEQWDNRMIEFLRRTGEELRTETQRLVAEVRDPEKQEKVKSALKELSVWARKAAEDVVRKAETAWRKPPTAAPWPEQGSGSAQTPSYDASAAAEPTAPHEDEDTDPAGKAAAPKRPVKKTVGRKSAPAKKAAAPKKSAAGAKTVGRKKG